MVYDTVCRLQSNSATAVPTVTVKHASEALGRSAHRHHRIDAVESPVDDETFLMHVSFFEISSIFLFVVDGDESLHTV